MKQLLICATVFLMLAAAGGAVPEQRVPEMGSGICPVMLRQYYAVDGTNDYDAALSADDVGEYSGSITFFSETAAYEATFDRVRVDGRARIVVRMPAHVRIDWASMDTAGLSENPATSCPTFVVTRQLSDGVVRVPSTPVVRAVLRGPLPDLPCGHVWVEARRYRTTEGTMYAPVAKPASAEMHVYIDSLGRVVSPQIVRSSGDISIDAQAITTVRMDRYHPATFLCVPVLSERNYIFTFDPAPK